MSGHRPPTSLAPMPHALNLAATSAVYAIRLRVRRSALVDAA